jgi:hypothetical protein
MRNIHKIIFLFVLIMINPSYSINKSRGKHKNKTVADPSGLISGNATVAVNATALNNI